MVLETTDEVWAMMVSNARKALTTQIQWQSPKQKRPYRIKEVTDEKIYVSRLAAGEDSSFTQDHFNKRIYKINNNGGTLPRKQFGAGVANMSTMVFLHPGLSWSADNETIITNEWRIESLNAAVSLPGKSATIPNDEGGKQKVARNIRKGQRKFRKHLLNAYQGKCCISSCDIIDVLEAAHIYDHHKAGINQPENGVLLRSDIHILFDMNLIKILPTTHRIEIDPALRHTEYGQYHGHKVADRKDGVALSDEYLQLKSEAGKIKDEETGY